MGLCTVQAFALSDTEGAHQLLVGPEQLYPGCIVEV